MNNFKTFLQLLIFLSVILLLLNTIGIKDDFCEINKILESRLNILENKILEKNNYKVSLTGYSLSKKQCNEDLENTAIMKKPIPGFTAAVSRDLMHLLNKKIYIDSYGVFLVNDLMNKRYLMSVDILQVDEESALKIGRKKDVCIVVLN